METEKAASTASTHSRVEGSDQEPQNGIDGIEASEKTNENSHAQDIDPDEPPRESLTRTRTDASEWEYVTGVKLAVVIIAVTGACFLMLLDTSIVATAIPRITNEFHSLQDIGWYGSSYLLSSAALQPMTGKIYSKFNSKYTFMLFLALFEFGSLLCAVATSSKMLIVARAVSGMGGSGIVNGALTIIAACVPLEKRSAYLGIMMGVGQLGILFGPLIGGALTEYATWRWCFYINLPIGGIVVGSLVFIKVPDRNAKSTEKFTLISMLQSLDIIGFLLFAPTAIMFLLALEWGGTTYAWGSATIIGLFCGSAGMFLVFMGWEYKAGDAAMIPLSMIRQRIVWSSCLTMVFFSANMMCQSYYMAIYFQSIRGKSPTLSGVFVLPGILSQMVMAVTSGILVVRLGYYLPWIITSTAIATIGTGLISTLTSNSSTGTWIGFQILAGFGRGCGLQMPIVAVQNAIKSSQISVGMSVLVFFQTFGSALFLSIAQTVLSAGLKNALPIYAPDVNAQAVINAGATGFRSVVSPDLVPGVILAYNKAVNEVFYLTTGAMGAAFLCSWGMGWKSVKKAKVVAPEA